MDDVLVTPEGRLVGRLDPVFKAVSSLYETQIIQDAADHVRVDVVAGPDFTAAQATELLAQLHARLGPTMRIDLVRVPHIARTARGKLRAVVNQVGGAQSSSG
jgi:phenylacetate-CoA ligase